MKKIANDNITDLIINDIIDVISKDLANDSNQENMIKQKLGNDIELYTIISDLADRVANSSMGSQEIMNTTLAKTLDKLTKFAGWDDNKEEEEYVHSCYGCGRETSNLEQCDQCNHTYCKRCFKHKIDKEGNVLCGYCAKNNKLSSSLDKLIKVASKYAPEPFEYKGYLVDFFEQVTDDNVKITVDITKPNGEVIQAPLSPYKINVQEVKDYIDTL